MGLIRPLVEGETTPIADILYDLAHSVLVVGMREDAQLPEQTVDIAKWVMTSVHNGALKLSPFGLQFKQAA